MTLGLIIDAGHSGPSRQGWWGEPLCKSWDLIFSTKGEKEKEEGGKGEEEEGKEEEEEVRCAWVCILFKF